jgi:hypothetical protein
MDRSREETARSHLKANEHTLSPRTLAVRRSTVRSINENTLDERQFTRIFDPLMCRIQQLDALLHEDGLWDPDRVGALKEQISNRQDDLEALYRTQGLLLEEYC